jgi:hypothetical protein
MGFFDDVVNVVKNVVANPGPVILGTAAGGLLGGSVGATVGTVAGVGEVVGEAAAEQARAQYVDGMNNAIAEVKAAKPDYAALQPLWIQFNVEAFQSAYKQKYGAACPPPEVLAPMIAVDVDARRKSLSDDAYKAELDNIHNGSVNASVTQLEHERDKPDDKDKPPTIDDYLDKLFSDIFNGIAHWLEDRFKENFEGVNNESGFGAKILRGGTGISWEDIKSRGLLGGDNSYLRRIIPTWSDNGGLFGGDNSFFRKPFG